MLWRESPTANLQVVFWTGHIVHSKSCKTTAAASTNFFSIPSWLRLLSVWRNQVRLPTRTVLVSYVHFDQSLKYWLTSILTIHIIHIRTYLLFDWGRSFKPLFPTLRLWCERSRCVLNFRLCTSRDMPSAECHRSLKDRMLPISAVWLSQHWFRFRVHDSGEAPHRFTMAPCIVVEQ